jgi:hypothetical protein
MKTVKELFMPYNLAMIAKQNGFKERCFSMYVTDNYGGTPEEPKLISVGGHWGSGIGSSMIDVKDFQLKYEECPAPLYAQIVNWFRDNHGLVLDVYQEWDYADKYTGKWEIDISILNNYKPDKEKPTYGGVTKFNEYNEAWNNLIELAFETISKK